MDRFDYREDVLHCEEVPVSRIAEEVGTPFYLYSLGTVLDHYHKLAIAFSGFDSLICYSVKANSNGAILSALAREGSGADIVSGGELFRARRAGIPAGRIVYSGVGKTDKELAYALDEGILMFNVESEQEVMALDRIAGSKGLKAPVAVRVNPDVDAHTHDYITTGKEENKFGIPFKSAVAVYQKLKALENIDIKGIDCHIGSQILSPEPYVKAVKTLRGLLEELIALGIKLTHLNIGGGFGIIYNDEKPATAGEIEEAIVPFVRDLGLTIITEPGRFIVGNAGALITRVQYVKKAAAKTFVIVDSGMNDLIRPALYGASHRIGAVAPGGSPVVVDVVGPICESGDFFALDLELPAVKQDELLALFSAGAYGFVMASTYNSRPRPAEVLVEGDAFRVVRERESYDDLVRGEKP